MSLIVPPESKRRPGHHLARHLHNCRVYVDRVDWVDVLSGAKTEIRKYGHATGIGREYPCPCVFYTAHPTTGEVSTALGVVDEWWVEPLGAISAESLAREGFEDFAAFRRYFAARYPKGGFRPLADVIVQRVRPMDPADLEHWRNWIWHRLYGQFA